MDYLEIVPKEIKSVNAGEDIITLIVDKNIKR